jgi:uncharacterized protein YfaP (DUF2135 family)
MRRSAAALFVIAATSGVLPAVAGDIDVDAPRAGWNVSGLTDRSEELNVTYPPALIDRGTQKYRTLIQGRLAQFSNENPHTIIVNGNPMPLYTGPDGRFARPYGFGSGSNSIEMREPGGGKRKRLQFYEAKPDKTQARIRIILAWDDNQAELDLHVITPDGQHAFWAAPVLNGGGGLDVDSVDGAGPEMFSTASPQHGTYYIYVNYWGNFGGGGYHFDETTRKKDVTTATVTLVLYENTPRERREIFVLPMRKIGDLMLAKSFSF